MSSFYCEKCGALCADSEHGYISGCEHYPPDVEPMVIRDEEEVNDETDQD